MRRHKPYLGLAPFERGHHERFFGRDAEVESLLARLHTNRRVIVTGAPQAGKTSLVEAGLLGRLAALENPSYRGAPRAKWVALHLRPGARPAARLRALIQRLSPDVGNVSSREALASLARVADEAGYSVVVVVHDVMDWPNVPGVLRLSAVLSSAALAHSALHIVWIVDDERLDPLRQITSVDVVERVLPLTPRRALVAFENMACDAGLAWSDAFRELVLARLHRTDVPSTHLFLLLALRVEDPAQHAELDRASTGELIDQLLVHWTEGIRITRALMLRTLQDGVPSQVPRDDFTRAFRERGNLVVDALIRLGLVRSHVGPFERVLEPASRLLWEVWPRYDAWRFASRARARTLHRIAADARAWGEGLAKPSPLRGGPLHLLLASWAYVSETLTDRERAWMHRVWARWLLAGFVVALLT